MTRLIVPRVFGRRRAAESRVLRALAAGDAYGWDLRGVTGLSSRRLERALNRLEETGAITSRLAETPAGPSIRLYSVRAEGTHPDA